MNRRTTLLTLLLASWVFAGCASILGIEDVGAGSDPNPDGGMAADAQTSFTVRGAAAGVLEPVELLLEYRGGDAVLRVNEDGSFGFPTEFQAGDWYEVSFIGTSSCVLEDAAGVIEGADPSIRLACEGVFLSQLTVSGPSAPALALDPAERVYEAEVSLLQQSASVTVVPAHPEATVSVAGELVLGGVASAPLPLDLGDNLVEVSVTGPGGGTRVYVVDLRRGAGLAQAAYGKASNTDFGDQFGYSVALSGDTLAVGARGEDSDATGVNGNQGDNSFVFAGAVYVFRRTGARWAQEAYLKASDTGSLDEFGFSVALSGDTLAVGSLEANDTGAVYVFQRSGTVWAQEARLAARNPDSEDFFGYSVALDGDLLAVGALQEDGAGGDQSDNSAPDSGAVYVFRRLDSGWGQEAYLKAANAEAGDSFGYSVAVGGDMLAVSAMREDSADADNPDDNSTANSGAVYVFRRLASGWVQEAYLKASNAGADDQFGNSIALDGDLLAVGADREASADTGVDADQGGDGAPDSGAVYVFRRSGTSWVQEAYLKASNTGAGDHFGTSVSLAGDFLAVGADQEDSAATGIDGEQANDSTPDSGAVYLFRRSGASWVQEAYLKASNTGRGDLFGDAVAVSGDTLAIGAHIESSAATGIDGDQSNDSLEASGAVYVLH
ncbi:cadherin-like beta sandwich domain-containing protein [Haliangium sp.]|uniref:cadherin-like beta sandwich domain-containing protein n=1 Tax=Haliangium sp. TaxID=2663208 RepID=UPI003D0A32FC